MRVTPATREKTRQNILQAARELFRADGFETVTTRAIARRAKIAAGTLFNYFPTKEALATAILEEALGAAESEFDETRRPNEAIEETLFALIAIQLRHLEPFRPWMAEVLEAGASLLRARHDAAGDAFRLRHLERVERLISRESEAGDDPITLHLYWSLYLGVLRFWSQDATAHQEATLAFLDRSMGMFCRALEDDGA